MNSTTLKYLLRSLRPVFILLFLQANVLTAQTDPKEQAIDDIKDALRLETQYFLQRDLRAWEGQWSHEHFVMKCYIRDGKYLEQKGWPVIRQSALDYMQAHPEPEQITMEVPEYEISVFESSAFVSYIQPDPIRGKKREIRLMVRENGRWKIGYMSTNYLTD
ncbi:nuclear transport factor 2 family protein [Poritiphilus flavus]|uniref:DUF4440 domain-containing protein n=1 Tax=Poritiphilus flavus TaxID=2697053 RepID=A0A6L9EEY8_9FLAO|nr:nuclear transport factor 2 family protein [Poritiphilus flavus]NAS13305.1 hypothetical protein [Poritiphilus flavus]